MINNTYKFTIPVCVLVLLLLGIVAKAQTAPYKEYRGVHLGMTATEARAKLGEPVFKSAEQDVYVFSASETTQIAYDAAQKVVTISTDYTGGAGAPDFKLVVGEGNMVQRPDGSWFRAVEFKADHIWASYNKSAGVVPVVTVTLQAMK